MLMYVLLGFSKRKWQEVLHMNSFIEQNVSPNSTLYVDVNNDGYVVIVKETQAL